MTFNQCQRLHNEERAREKAREAEKRFKELASLLSNRILAVVGFILGILSWFMSALISGIIMGLEAAAAILSNTAGDIADIFASEVNRLDQSGKLDYAWFTKTNLEADASRIDNIHWGDALLGGGTGILGAITTFFASLLKGAFSSTVDMAFKIMKAGMTGVVVEVVAVEVGVYIFDQMAQNYIKQEEADAA